jgi:hypothetical protein
VALAGPAAAQVSGPVGGPVGGTIGGPVGGVAASPSIAAARPAGSGIAIPPVSSSDDDDPVAPGVGINTGRGVNISANLVTEYGSNLLRQGEGQTLGGRSGSRSDFRIRPSVSVNLGLPAGRQQLYLNASVGRDFYVRNSFLNRERVGAVAGVAYGFGSSCGGRLQASYEQRQTQLEEFVDVRNSLRRTTSGLLSLTCSRPYGISPSADVTYTNNTNSLESRRRRNSRTISAGIGASYAIGVRGSIGVRANYADTVFPNEIITLLDLSVQPPRVLESFEYSLKSYGGSLTGQYRLGERVSFVGNVGYSRIAPRAGVGEPYGSLTYSASVGYTGTRIFGSASAGRAVTPGRGGEATFFVANSYTLDVGYTLPSGISAYAGAARSTREFRGELDTLPLARSSATTDRAYLGVRTQIGRLLSASAEVNTIRRRVIPSIFNYTSNGVRLSLSASF